MRIVKAYPPNYGQIIAAIPAVGRKPGIIFTYGDTIYCPAGNTNLPDHLIAHEQVHCDEQAAHPGGIVGWWAEYLADNRFRLNQELLAYQTQYKACANRAERKAVLPHIAKDLSGAMYGNLIDKSTARHMIVEGGVL